MQHNMTGALERRTMRYSTTTTLLHNTLGAVVGTFLAYTHDYSWIVYIWVVHKGGFT